MDSKLPTEMTLVRLVSSTLWHSTKCTAPGAPKRGVDTRYFKHVTSDLREFPVGSPRMAHSACVPNGEGALHGSEY